jgi:signal transduction histidine kinase
LQDHHSKMAIIGEPATPESASDCAEALRRARQQIQTLKSRVVRERWAERQRLAADLHDDLGQLLVALAIEADGLKQRFDGAHRTERMSELAHRAVDAARRAFADLRSPTLDKGLVMGLKWLAEEFKQRTGVPCAVEVGHRLNPEVSTRGQGKPEPQGEVAEELFRIVQEALNNVERHAAASRTWIRIGAHDEGWDISIHDNGCGFDLTQPRSAPHFGMLGMRERAMRVGADLQITSAPEQGTIVRVIQRPRQLMLWPSGS